MQNLKEIIYAGSIVVLTGLLDDKINLSPNIKLLSVSIPTLYLATAGFGVTDLGNYEYIGTVSLGKFYFIFTVLSVGLLTNSYNYIDGIDGLLTSLTITSLIYVSLLVSDSLIVDFIIFAVIALVINMIFNFLPKTNNYKIFAGNSGSLFVGFFISFLIIYLYKFKNIHPAYLIWICWYPVYDFLYVTFYRTINKKLFYIADNNHFHHAIFNFYKKSHLKTTLFINSINIIVIFSGYQICKNFGELFSITAFFILFIFFCIIRRKKIKQKFK